MFNIKEIYCKLYHIIDHQNFELIGKKEIKKILEFYSKVLSSGVFSQIFIQKIEHL